MFDKEYVDHQKYYQLKSNHALINELHLAVEIGKAKSKEYATFLFELDKDECLIFCVYEKTGLIWIDGKCISLDLKTTLILSGKHNVEISLNKVEFEYCLIKGKKMNKVMDANIIVLSSNFYKKTNYFFSSVYSSFTKYKSQDLFANSSSVYRFYSDVLHINQDKDNNKSLLAQKVVEYIENNYTEDISLDGISESLGYSKYYILHVFKEVMELSVHDYIIRRRLTQAKYLLLEEKMSIDEIAHCCGFKSDIALYKAFKNVYSVTPGQFKKMSKVKVDES